MLTGNQTGVLLLDYLIGAKQRTGKMPANPVALKTIVTTEMARKVAETNGLKCYDTFTGFKFLAEKKDKLENAGEGKVIFAYEESYGYMLGDYVRDKDAVTAALSLTEMAAWYAGQGMTLYDALLACYEKYGYYGEKTLNLVMPGLDGLKKMADLMANLREKPPVEIAGVGVLQQKDYKDGSVVNVADGAKSTMSCPAPTCCAMRWPTAPASSSGPPAPSPRSRSTSWPTTPPGRPATPRLPSTQSGPRA